MMAMTSEVCHASRGRPDLEVSFCAPSAAPIVVALQVYNDDSVVYYDDTEGEVDLDVCPLTSGALLGLDEIFAIFSLRAQLHSYMLFVCSRSHPPLLPWLQ